MNTLTENKLDTMQVKAEVKVDKTMREFFIKFQMPPGNSVASLVQAVDNQPIKPEPPLGG
jgi:hypothetical protein